jgi:uncharacterized surface protein with fasciclin (FAS1) repeats
MRIRSFAIFAAVVLAVGSAGTAFAGPKGQGPKGPTIVDVAAFVNSQSGEFETLIAAVNAADPAVAATLTGGGQHTVFAPTNAAFAALGLNPTNLCLLSTDDLTKILLYHVARGNRDAGEVTSSDTIRTLLGARLEQANGVLKDQLGRSADIVMPNVPAANGIIHVINAVVLPFAPTIDPSGCQ